MPWPKNRAQSEQAMPVPSPVFASVTRPFLVAKTSPPLSANSSVSPMRWCSHCRARLQAHLPGDRLHHAIGGKLRPDDRKNARRQHGWRRRSANRHFRPWPLWRYETRAQEPVVRVAAVEATLKQTIVEGARAQLRVVKRKGAGCRRGTVDSIHHQDAVAGSLRAQPSDIGDINTRVASGGAAIGDGQRV